MARTRYAPPLARPSPRDNGEHATGSQSRATSSEEEAGHGSHSKQSPATRVPKGRKIAPVRGRTLQRGNSMSSGSQEAGDGEESSGAVGDESADDSANDADPPDVLAPSGVLRRNRSRPTGLSVSFASSVITNEVRGRKRARSPLMDGYGSTTLNDHDRSKDTTYASAFLESDEDDDELYNAVDLISESEDEAQLEQTEEHAIIVSREKEDLFAIMDSPSAPFRPVRDLQGISFDDDETPHFDEHYGRTVGPDMDLATATTEDVPPQRIRLPGERRVHFIEDLGSNYDEASLEIPSRRSQLAGQSDRPYTNGQSAAPIASQGLKRLLRPSKDPDQDEEGWTTEEELLPPKTVHRPQEKLHWTGVANAAIDRATRRRRNSFSAYRPSESDHRNAGPSRGSWTADPTKPIVIINHTGKRVFLPAKNTQVPSSPADNFHHGGATPKVQRLLASLNRPKDEVGFESGETEVDEGDGANSSFRDTVLGSSAEKMLSDFSRGLYDHMRGRHSRAASDSSVNDQVRGPVQNINTNDWEEEEDGDDAGENNLRMADLLDLSSDNEAEGEQALPALPELSTSQETAVPLGRSPSPESPVVSIDSPEWPPLHRPSSKVGAGVKRDRNGPKASLSTSPPATPSKLVAKYAGMNSTPKRVKTKH